LTALGRPISPSNSVRLYGLGSVHRTLAPTRRSAAPTHSRTHSHTLPQQLCVPPPARCSTGCRQHCLKARSSAQRQRRGHSSRTGTRTCRSPPCRSPRHQRPDLSRGLHLRIVWPLSPSCARAPTPRGAVHLQPDSDADWWQVTWPK